jgi:O-antigen ligase
VATVTRYLERGQTQEDLMTLDNRTAIYDSVLQMLGDHWLLGRGFRSRTLVFDQQLDGSGVSHAHNAILDAAAGLGIAGAATATLVLLALLACSGGLLLGRRWAGQPKIRERGVEFTALCVPILTYSFMDSSFALGVGPFTLCFVAILIDLTRCRSLASASTPRAVVAAPATTNLRRSP